MLAWACAVASCSPAVFYESDGGTDAAPDVSSDGAPLDGPITASDAGNDVACAYSGAIPTCGGATCASNQSCCVSSAPPECISTATTCAGASLQCLSSMDCSGSGVVCCLMGTADAGQAGLTCPRKVGSQATSQCTSNCSALNNHRICGSDTDCPPVSPHCILNEITGTTFVFGACD